MPRATKYKKAREIAFELYSLVPYITPTIVYNYLEKSDLDKIEIPKSTDTIFYWFKEFDKVSNKDRYEKLMNIMPQITQIIQERKEK
tara:strand:- start:459 stop:719 length:261 start_codon:yes stop_codon:yes gene_type:complete